MFVWFVGWLDGWLVEWLVGWLDVWLVGWLVGWMVGWLFDLPLPANQKLRPLFLPKPLHPATVSRYHTSEGPTYPHFPPTNLLYITNISQSYLTTVEEAELGRGRHNLFNR